MSSHYALNLGDYKMDEREVNDEEEVTTDAFWMVYGSAIVTPLFNLITKNSKHTTLATLALGGLAVIYTLANDEEEDLLRTNILTRK